MLLIAAATIISAEELETRKTVKKAAPIENELEARTEEPEEMTIKVEVVRETTITASSSTAASPIIISTTENVLQSSPVVEITSEKLPEIALTTEVLLIESSHGEAASTESSPDDDNEDPSTESIVFVPTKPPKRKVLYVNQQQSGRLNVRLELSDVSVIVIPKNKDPQLSLLNLLFKSAQKSNMAKKKQEKMKVEVQNHDEYSKYKSSLRPAEDSLHNLGSNAMPFIESRAPYRVDISSTLGQQSPAIEITPNAHQHSAQPQFARSPIMQLLKPIPYTNQNAAGHLPHTNRIFKRSIDSRLLGIDDEIPSDEEELTESIFNSLDKKEEFNGIDRFDGSEFVLLGATENCGPGRRRNSYQICIAVDDE